MMVTGGVDILRIPASATILVVHGWPPFQLFEAHIVFLDKYFDSHTSFID